MSRLYENIKHVCKKSGHKLGDLEKPYNPGFISRYDKADKVMELPLSMVYRIAKACDVSIEDLVEKDLTRDDKLAEIRAKMEQLKALEAELMGESDEQEI